MAIYNTGADSANTMIRAFLTKIGELYLGSSFNTGSGAGKALWESIKDDFNYSCAYCGNKKDKLTIEHLVMFNRIECGLHHPGNIVPCCSQCNRRKKNDKGEYISWDQQLSLIAKKHSDYTMRRKKILKHIDAKNYPKLTKIQKNALKSICEHLYDSTKQELNKSLNLYQSIDTNLLKNITS